MLLFGFKFRAILPKKMNNALLSLILIPLLFLQGCSLIQKDESEWTVQEFYEAAKEAFDDGQWDTATQYYEKLKAYFPYGKYAEQSYLELAYSYYKYDEPESAIRELNEFIRTYPKHSALPYAYYLKALASDSINRSWLDSWLSDPARRDMSSTVQAYNAYQEVLKRFPDSAYAPAARTRSISLRNRLARHEYQVALYYFEREAYLAAANRAKMIIENYPRSRVNLKALELMKNSYTRLGMHENAKNTQEVINLNTQQTPK